LSLFFTIFPNTMIDKNGIGGVCKIYGTSKLSEKITDFTGEITIENGSYGFFAFDHLKTKINCFQKIINGSFNVHGYNTEFAGNYMFNNNILKLDFHNIQSVPLPLKICSKPQEISGKIIVDTKNGKSF